jgi:predicted O-methyltransferase YrrM
LAADVNDGLTQVRAVRARLAARGPASRRAIEGDFERVALPAADGDHLRDALIADGARVVIEVGLAYGSSALAIGEALVTTGGPEARHIVIDPFQATAYANVGWDALRAAGLTDRTRLMTEPSSLALPSLVAERCVADAAFVDGSHRFHEVFVDLYFLRKLVRPRGLIILDDAAWPSVGTALRYFDRNLGWQPVPLPGRLVGRRLPDTLEEPAFTDFQPF